jgi:hypothetical protein
MWSESQAKVNIARAAEGRERNVLRCGVEIKGEHLFDLRR